MTPWNAGAYDPDMRIQPSIKHSDRERDRRIYNAALSNVRALTSRLDAGAKLTGAAEDGKVSLAQAKEAFETLEVGNGPEPLVGVCGGEGAPSRLLPALLYRYIGLRYRSVRHAPPPDLTLFDLPAAAAAARVAIL